MGVNFIEVTVNTGDVWHRDRFSFNGPGVESRDAVLRRNRTALLVKVFSFLFSSNGGSSDPDSMSATLSFRVNRVKRESTVVKAFIPIELHREEEEIVHKVKREEKEPREGTITSLEKEAVLVEDEGEYL
jgi:hypothetical protein